MDIDNERIRINPPSDWNEENPNDPAYIANKPELGTVVSYDVAQDELDLSRNIPTSKTVYNAIRDISAEVASTKALLGYPYKAATRREMIEENKIYIYTGSEAGMNTGHWYYFDGIWVDGGLFNSAVVATDTTLLVPEVPADAAETGNRINDLKAETTDIYNTLNTTANDIAELQSNDIAISSSIDDLQSEISSLDAEAELYINELVTEDGYLYGLHDGVDLTGPIGPFAGGSGGGGGGGGDTIDAVFTATNTTSWVTTTISYGDNIDMSFTWSSIENGNPTGPGTVTVTVNDTVKATISVQQGDVVIPLKSYCTSEKNRIKIRISDQYNQGKTWMFNVNTIDLSISSTFDTSIPFSGQITFPYTPYGQISKTVKFYLDGKLLGTATTSATNRQLTYIIPAQPHGSHSLEVYFESEVNGKLVKSNTLHYEFMSVVEDSTAVVITIPYVEPNQSQYSSIVIPFTVYDPNSYTSVVDIYEGSTLLISQTVDRSQHSYTYRFDRPGTVTIKFVSGETTKNVVFNVSSLDIDVDPITEDLVLYLTAKNRSNGETNRDIWAYGNIRAEFSGFTWMLDGWQTDNDGINVLRLLDDARVTIPYKPFENDFKNTGKTIEIEFATRQVFDYNTPIIQCFSNNIGFIITPQNAMFRGAVNSIDSLYKDNEHVRLTIVVEKQTENRLILFYINGIMSRVIQYASGERFSQSNPVNITIGSDDSGVDIYNIRIYDNDLNRQQVVHNWIADTQIGNIMLERYNHNNIYDYYGNITPENLPKDLPYLMIDAPLLPRWKGDKQTVSGSFTDPKNPSKSFTFDEMSMNVQGTSSAVYFRKNYDMQFKKGFIINGERVSNYALKDDSIPFNRFVIKADVASSESANNTVLSSYFSDSIPYKPREVIANPRIRQAIEGIPIVVFWHDTENDVIHFMGKHNMNLPKRAYAPLGYPTDLDSVMQSWEIERNNSANVKFKAADFETMSYDEKTGESYPEWYNDWECRFPEDTLRNHDILGEFVQFILSTDRDQATNNNLESPVTYSNLRSTATVDGYPDDDSYTITGANNNYSITFTKDTKAYRLTKFRVEFGDYAEIDSYIYYYLYTELFLMIDSRAKNMFIGFKGSDVTSDKIQYIKRKAVAEIYDADTAIGTNNSGVLMFSYNLEDTDHVSSVIAGGDDAQEGTEAAVFNAQDSVLFVNLRDAFKTEIGNMYEDLRSNGKWSYNKFKTLFEEHQSKWPEVIFNEDAYEKYLVPLIEGYESTDVDGKPIKSTDYLTMIQGSKAEQRKWWLSNRFKYMDSKYYVADAAENRISARLFNSGTITLTMAIDMYAAVAFGGGTRVSLKRTTANTPTEFTYIIDESTTVQEMETWFYSGDMITDVGDLSKFYPNEIKFAMASRLKNLKIGDSSPTYSNGNLNSLDVSNSPMLEMIDVRNCPMLGTKDGSGSIDLENSPRLREAYFDGTSIKGIYLANGAAIEILHLPNTITSLILQNLTRLREFVCPSFENISTLMLANIDTEIIDPLEILNAVNNNTLVNISGLHLEIDSIEEVNDFYQLLNRMKGVTREKSLGGEWIYNEVSAAQVTGEIVVSFYLNGDDVEEFNNKYPYIKFIPTVGSEAKIRYYDYTGDNLLYTETVYDGASGVYDGTPEKTSDDQYQYTFAGWSRRKNSISPDPEAIVDVVVNTNVYAAYEVETKSYTISFVNEIRTETSTTVETLYTEYNVPYGVMPQYEGETPVYKGIDVSGVYDFDHWEPEIEPVTGPATYTAAFVDKSPVFLKYLKKTLDEYVSSTRATTIAEHGIHSMPSLKSVKTYATQIRSYGISNCYTNLKVIDLANVEPTTIYPYAFSQLTNLTHLIVRSTTVSFIDSTSSLERTNISSRRGGVYVPRNLVDAYRDHEIWSKYSIFPIESYPLTDFSTISDSWEDIMTAIDNGIYTTKYKIGDIKYLEGIGMMEIIAFDTDNKSDGSGKAAITWLSVGTIAERQYMNLTPKTSEDETSLTAGGWKNSDLRAYLRESLFPRLPELLQERIVPVTKVTSDYVYGSKSIESSPETLWIPSKYEMNLGTDCESSGPIYYEKFVDSSFRVKYSQENTAQYYWLRSLDLYSETEHFVQVMGNGDSYSGQQPNVLGSVTVGFCL